MKKIFLVLFMLIIYASCSGQSLRMIYDTPQTYDAAQIDYVLLYIYEGDQALFTNIGPDSFRVIPTQDSLFKLGYDSLIAVPYDSGYYHYEHRHFFNPQKVISAGAQAVDFRGRRSGIIITDYFDKPKDLYSIKIGR